MGSPRWVSGDLCSQCRVRSGPGGGRWCEVCLEAQEDKDDTRDERWARADTFPWVFKHTYAAQYESGGPIKIGGTDQPIAHRLRGYITAHWEDLILLAELDVPEAKAHHDLASWRVRRDREWFRDNPEVRAYLDEHKKG